MSVTIKIKPVKGGINVNAGCAFCGKPITRSVKSGMTCEDLCTDKWVRWERLGRPSFQNYLATLGKLEEALAELEALGHILFRNDGTPKFSE